MSGRVPIAVIKGGLQGRLTQLLRELLPGGRERNGLYEAKNPTRADTHLGSFKVWMRGQAQGAWKDYATGDKGDVLDLVRYVKGGDRGDAIRWAEDWLGLRTVDPATLERMRVDSDRRREADRARARQADERKVQGAGRIWGEALSLSAEHPAATYLRARGCPLEAVPHLERDDIRFHPRLEHWQSATYDVRAGRRVKLAPGPILPAMIWAIRNAAGALRAVHCTFLRPDGTTKAALEAPKLMLGLVAGGVIRLSRGPDDMSPEEARQHGVLSPVAIGEGVEDGLTLAIAAPEARVWAATSLGNLGNVPLDHPCVSGAVVARDNDWAKPQAAAAFERAIARLEEHGKPVSVISAPGREKDFNELVRRDL